MSCDLRRRSRRGRLAGALLHGLLIGPAILGCAAEQKPLGSRAMSSSLFRQRADLYEGQSLLPRFNSPSRPSAERPGAWSRRRGGASSVATEPQPGVVVYAPEKAGAEGATAGSEGQVVPHIGGVGEAAALSTAAKEARSYREALVRTGLSVGAAIAFGLGVWYVRGQTSAMEFFAGYLIEESLSIDNIFVFIMLFDYFKVPMDFQPRALTWGIVGAIAMRGVMILVGVAALQKFRWVVLVFAGLLLASAGKLLMGHEDDGELSENFMLKATSRLFPSTPNYDGDRFFTKVDGKRLATPLFMCLVCIELSDFVFAVDSIPAVLGVSKDPLIVYSSNIFAIMALRSLYTLVSAAVNHLEYIKPAVALVLAFVGVKMGLEYFHVEVSIAVSLGVVISILSGGVGASLIKRRLTAARAPPVPKQHGLPLEEP